SVESWPQSLSRPPCPALHRRSLRTALSESLTIAQILRSAVVGKPPPDRRLSTSPLAAKMQARFWATRQLPNRNLIMPDSNSAAATPPAKFFNRELSWLEFNQRVLDE